MTTLPTKYVKTPGFATTAGLSYEHKMAALVFLRASCTGREFQLATNVQGGEVFDDVILKVRRADAKWDSYFVQLKTTTHPLTPRMLLGEEKAFSLPTYFRSYREITKKMASNPNQAILEGPIQHCQFLLFTNAKIHAAVKGEPLITFGKNHRGTLGEVEQLFGLGTGSVFRFDTEGHEEMDTAVWDCLTKEPEGTKQTNEEQKKTAKEAASFMGRLLLFCAQPSGKLDELAKAELRNMEDKADLTGDYVDRLWECFLKNVIDWCETKNTILDRQSDLLLSARRRVVMEMHLASEEKTYRIGCRFESGALSSLKVNSPSALGSTLRRASAPCG